MVKSETSQKLNTEVYPAVVNHKAISNNLSSQANKTATRNYILSGGGDVTHYTSTNPIPKPGFIKAGISIDSTGSEGVAQRKHNLETMKQFAANQPSGGGKRNKKIIRTRKRKRKHVLIQSKKTRIHKTRKNKSHYKGGYRYGKRTIKSKNSKKSKQTKNYRSKGGGNKTRWGCYS